MLGQEASLVKQIYFRLSLLMMEHELHAYLPWRRESRSGLTERLRIYSSSSLRPFVLLRETGPINCRRLLEVT